MWRTTVFFAIIVCSYAEQLEQYNITIQNPVPAAATNRIVGGSETTIQQYPFAIQLLVNSQLQCGGSLLTLRHVLTAAHCFYDGNNNLIAPSVFSVRAGSTRLSSGGSVVRLSMYIVHPSYNPFTYDNDIAVIVLRSRLRASTSLNIVGVPMQGYAVPDNSTVVHVGWGRTHPAIQAPSEILRHVAVYVVNNSLCAQRYREIYLMPGVPATVTQNMICAGVLDVGGRDACQGDSGGPLLFNNSLVGVTSWGYGCAEPRYPGVSARVSSYTNWINATITRYNAGSRLESVSLATMTSLVAFLLLSSKRDIS
ncbi:trypsin CFT-1 [Amyelois transitella]|uniref:trypsin CFT-1 n=1 Tax=Amyelois transitella TaxID=680683 RepID=UPI00067A83DC|nr:trypsin CFT-1 [Amyelois transitella]